MGFGLLVVRVCLVTGWGHCPCFLTRYSLGGMEVIGEGEGGGLFTQ